MFIEFIVAKFGCHANVVKNAVTAKCNNECKTRTRAKKKKSDGEGVRRVGNGGGRAVAAGITIVPGEKNQDEIFDGCTDNCSEEEL